MFHVEIYLIDPVLLWLLAGLAMPLDDVIGVPFKFFSWQQSEQWLCVCVYLYVSTMVNTMVDTGHRGPHHGGHHDQHNGRHSPPWWMFPC